MQEAKSYSRMRRPFVSVRRMDAVRILIAQIVKDRNLKLADLSRELGKNHAYLQQFLKRNVPDKLPEDVRSRLAELLGVDEQALGAPVRARRPDSSVDAVGAVHHDLEGLVWHGIAADEISQIQPDAGLGDRDSSLEITIDIGNGNSVQGVGVVGTWRMPDAVLRRRAAAPIRSLFFVECYGNSMEPKIRDGDVVLVDTTKRDPTMPGVFAVRDGSSFTVKQVERLRGSDPAQLRLIPINRDYAAEVVLADDVEIIGRYVARFTMD